MSQAILPKTKIAAPCHARWEDMAGDERSRFCAQCDKRVYNFSRMSPEEISQFILDREGRACVRFYQRTDGTMLLENCPVGTERLIRRVKIAVCSTIALFVFGMTALLANIKQQSRIEAVSRVELLWDDALWKIKGWLGIQRPPIMMGIMCVPPAPTTNAPTLPK
jgi:hypothetical protein